MPCPGSNSLGHVRRLAVGISETLAASVSRRDLAVEHEPPAEGDARPPEVAVGQRLADRRGRDRASSQLEQRHALGRQAVGGAHRGQALHGSHRLVPEREVDPHRRVHGMHAPDEHVADERVGGHPGELGRERQHDEDVDAGVLDQRRFAFHRGEQARLPSGVSTSRGCRSNVMATDRVVASRRPFDGRLQHRAMPEVHPVEEPHRHHRRVDRSTAGTRCLARPPCRRSLTDPSPRAVTRAPRSAGHAPSEGVG